MKKYNLYNLGIAAMMTAVISSCNNDLNSNSSDNSDSSVISFTATGSTSRTILDDNTIKWSKDDKIAIFSAYESQPYEFIRSDENTEAETATFTGTRPSSGFPYFALYPFNELSAFSDNKIRTSLTSEQTAVANTFDNGLNISVCKATEDNNLQFKNACALFKFIITNTIAGKVSLSADTYLAGDLDIEITETGVVTTVPANANASNTVTLSGSLQKNTPYIMAVAPFKGTPQIKLDDADITIDSEMSGFEAKPGYIYTFRLTPRGAKITEEVKVNSIKGVTANKLEIELEKDVTLGTPASEDLSKFSLKVTNGNYSGELKVTNVEAVKDDKKSLILTVSDDVQFYYDDNFEVKFNADETSALLTLESGNYVKLTTGDKAESCGYEDVIIDEDFEGADFVLADFCELQEDKNPSASVETDSNGNKGLQFSLSSGSCNAWLKIEPSRTYQEGYTYFLSFSASDKSENVWPKFIFEPTGSWTQKVNFGFESNGVFKDYTHERTYPEDFENDQVATSFFTTVKLTLMFSSTTFIDNVRFTARMYRPVTNDYSGNHDGFENGSNDWKNN